MVTTCDRCEFACEACYVSGAWEFLCDLCRAIEDAELEARTPRTITRTMTAHEYASEAMMAFDATVAALRSRLTIIATATAALAVTH